MVDLIRKSIRVTFGQKSVQIAKKLGQSSALALSRDDPRLTQLPFTEAIAVFANNDVKYDVKVPFVLCDSNTTDNKLHKISEGPNSGGLESSIHSLKDTYIKTSGEDLVEV